MDKKPKIASTSPAVLEIEPGTYYWCSCGLSKSQPFCDGSHSGSGFSPKEFTITEKRKIALCTCKQSSRGHICDGSHKDLQQATE